MTYVNVVYQITPSHRCQLSLATSESLALPRSEFYGPGTQRVQHRARLVSAHELHSGPSLISRVLNRSAGDVLAAVRTGLSKYSTKQVTLTGHSLG